MRVGRAGVGVIASEDYKAKLILKSRWKRQKGKDGRKDKMVQRDNNTKTRNEQKTNKKNKTLHRNEKRYK